MEFEHIVKSRYATKKFDGKRLPDEKVKKLFELIRLSPTSLNLQPYVVKVVTDPAIKKRLAPASWNQAQIESCSHLLVFCANTDLEGNINKIEKESLAAGLRPGQPTAVGSRREPCAGRRGPCREARVTSSSGPSDSTPALSWKQDSSTTSHLVTVPSASTLQSAISTNRRPARATSATSTMKSGGPGPRTSGHN